MSRLERTFVFILGALALGVGPVAGQVLDKTDQTIIADWATAQNIVDTTAAPAVKWQPVGATPGGITMRAVLSRKQGNQGKAEVAIRLEHFAATAGVGGKPTLSEMAKFEVDCPLERLRSVAMVSYSQHNFTGDKREDTKPGPWTPNLAMQILAPSIASACGA